MSIQYVSNYASKFLFISVREAEAPWARGHLGHEAPPMTHVLKVTVDGKLGITTCLGWKVCENSCNAT